MTALDSHLTTLIESYTLRGLTILAHCRGGVGRAGIIACCWMLKLGLCGWCPSDASSPQTPVRPGEASADTVRLVERLISVVRRRRSPKAIETYEQVRFLVEYTEFLRSRADTAESSSLMDVFADWDTSVE